MFNCLQVNVLFMEVLRQISICAKFMKFFFTNKRKPQQLGSYLI